MYGTYIVQEIEVDQFAAVFFKPRRKESPTDNALMNSIVDKAVTRFEQAIGDDQEKLRNRIESFRRLYSFLSQVIPFGDSKLEKLDAYLRFLETKLPAREATGQTRSRGRCAPEVLPPAKDRNACGPRVP